MFRISGYFFDGSKSAGFCTHAWIFLPSKLGYQISSAGVSFSSENSFLLKSVNCAPSLPVAASTANSSPSIVVVDTSATIFLPSFDVLNAITS